MVHSLFVSLPGQMHPDADVLDGDRNRVTLVDSAPDAGGGIKPGYVVDVFRSGRRVNTEHLPTRVWWKTNQLPFDYYTPMGIPCISGRLKDLIERAEPDVHQFAPVDFVKRDGAVIQRHYIFVVGNRIDSIDYDLTRYPIIGGFLNGADPTPDVWFDSRKIAGRSIWIDRHDITCSIYLTDGMAQALKDANLIGVGVAPRGSEIN